MSVPGFFLTRCYHFTSFGGVGDCLFLASCISLFFCLQKTRVADAFTLFMVLCSFFSSEYQNDMREIIASVMTLPEC